MFHVERSARSAHQPSRDTPRVAMCSEIKQLTASETTNQHNRQIINRPKARFPLAELTGRVDGPSTRLVETHARQHDPC